MLKDLSHTPGRPSLWSGAPLPRPPGSEDALLVIMISLIRRLVSERSPDPALSLFILHQIWRRSSSSCARVNYLTYHNSASSHRDRSRISSYSTHLHPKPQAFSCCRLRSSLNILAWFLFMTVLYAPAAEWWPKGSSPATCALDINEAGDVLTLKEGPTALPDSQLHCTSFPRPLSGPFTPVEIKFPDSCVHCSQDLAAMIC